MGVRYQQCLAIIQPGIGNIPDIVSLKREFEQVVIQQVGSLRSEVKRVRYVAELWLSSPGIMMKTEKNKQMKSIGNEMAFHLH
ncbi:unnamed protein product [Rhizophagus irregularis]|nr:unnamed protein product [Rhizophagus irregularis]